MKKLLWKQQHAVDKNNYKNILPIYLIYLNARAVIAQLGERKTEDLKVSGSIPDCGSFFPSE